MSVAELRGIRVRYHWEPSMIPWWRQIFGVLLAGMIALITLYGIDQTQVAWVILSTQSVAILGILLVFGVEMEGIEVELGDGWLYVNVNFSDTTEDESGSDVPAVSADELDTDGDRPNS